MEQKAINTQNVEMITLALKGNEKEELMLTDVMLRIFVANDRMGLYNKEGTI